MSKTNKDKRKFKMYWSPTAVAVFIGKPYQTARNMMLTGVFGQPRYDETTSKLTVLSASVRRWKTEQRKKMKATTKIPKNDENEKTGL